jgi:nitrate reductase delta subunit
MHAFDQITPLFAYPDGRYVQKAQECAAALDSDDLRTFAALMAAVPLEARQELFVQTFDLNPSTTLEIGWHLFGEQYERGAFLVQLRAQLRDAGIPESGELPDHLLHVLPLVARMSAEEAAEFCRTKLVPALEKIAAALPDGSPFGRLIRATLGCAPARAGAGV